MRSPSHGMSETPSACVLQEHALIPPHYYVLLLTAGSHIRRYVADLFIVPRPKNDNLGDPTILLRQRYAGIAHASGGIYSPLPLDLQPLLRDRIVGQDYGVMRRESGAL